MIAAFSRSLDADILKSHRMEWPEGDGAKVQVIAIAKGVRYAAKRSKSFFGKEGSSQKRLRVE